MTLAAFSGPGFLLPSWIAQGSTPGIESTNTLDATGEKIAWAGCFWHPDHASKDISRVWVYFRIVSKAGGSGLTLSLQDVDLTTGQWNPDGVADQTVDIPNAHADLISGGFVRTDALSANRTVSPGDVLSIVLEFDASGRLGSDAFTPGHFGAASFFQPPALRDTAVDLLFNGATWSTPNSRVCVVMFECSDGTFGILDGMVPARLGTASGHSGSTPDEFALKLVPDHEIAIDALWATTHITNIGATFDIVLYDSGGTVLETVSVHPRTTLDLTGYGTLLRPLTALRTLTKDATYYVAVKPTQASFSVSVPYTLVSNVDHWVVTPGRFTGCTYASRTDAGAWTEVTTQFPHIGVRVASIHDGAGGGGGGRYGVIGAGF